MKTQNEIWQEYYKQRKAPSYPTDAIARFFEKSVLIWLLISFICVLIISFMEDMKRAESS